MSQTDSTVYVLAHIDILPFPPHLDAGQEVLLKFARDIRNQAGLTRFELLREIPRPNHFQMIAVWDSAEAYEHHLGHPDTLAYRQALHPTLGSPVDDRVHVLEP